MSGDPAIVEAPPLLIAAVRRHATSATIAGLITNSGVWDLMRSRGITSPGHNVVVYWQTARHRLSSSSGVEVDIGADVDAPFESTPALRCTETPSGHALYLRHIGPYTRLSDSYAIMSRWARANSYNISGPFWEIYGHWNDNPDLLETDLFYLIT